MRKEDIIRITHNASINYRDNLTGKIFLYIYGSKYFEVSFGVNNFKHLTGIASNLYAKDFYKKVLNNHLRNSDIYFNKEHPKDLCNLKMTEIENLHLITNSDILVYEDFSTGSLIYKLSISNLNFSVCLSEKKDKEGNIINNTYYPKSFRVGDEFDRANSVFPIDYIFKKEYLDLSYNRLIYGDINKLKFLPNYILQKIDIQID